MRQQAVNFGTRVITDDIQEVDFSENPFTLTRAGGGEIRARSVIVATGASANWLGLESEELFKNRGVSACAVCDGALPRFREKELVVVGGGDSAVEEATYLTKFASRVHLFIAEMSCVRVKSWQNERMIVRKLRFTTIRNWLKSSVMIMMVLPVFGYKVQPNRAKKPH